MTTPSSGYRNSHHHCQPRTMTCSAPGGAAMACVRKTMRIVGIAITRSTSAGRIVQVSSSKVWPRTCAGNLASGRARKRAST